MKTTRHFKQAAFLFIMISCISSCSFAQLTDIDTAKVLLPRYNTNKKLIEYGWNYPDVNFLLNNMNSLGKRPFQGIVFKPYWPEYSPGYPQNIFYPFDVSESYMQLDKLATIHWANTLTDNFMMFWVAGPTYADWFNDTQWAIVDTNVRRISKAVHCAKAKGIFWDTEHMTITSGNTTRYTILITRLPRFRQKYGNEVSNLCRHCLLTKPTSRFLLPVYGCSRLGRPEER